MLASVGPRLLSNLAHKERIQALPAQPLAPAVKHHLLLRDFQRHHCLFRWTESNDALHW